MIETLDDVFSGRRRCHFDRQEILSAADRLDPGDFLRLVILPDGDLTGALLQDDAGDGILATRTIVINLLRPPLGIAGLTFFEPGLLRRVLVAYALAEDDLAPDVVDNVLRRPFPLWRRCIYERLSIVEPERRPR